MKNELLYLHHGFPEGDLTARVACAHPRVGRYALT